jgi:hypothetical protein
VPAPAGYSGTPLSRKLGIGEGAHVRAWNAPAGYRELLAPIPAGVRFTRTCGPQTDLVHLFVRSRVELVRALPMLRVKLRTEVPVWVSWPKKASGVVTDVTEDVIRAVALPLGFVDVKVCAVDATWSGLKLMVRRSER